MINPIQAFGSLPNMIAQFQQFKQQIIQQGIDPQARVQELLRNGQMSQQQFEQLRQMASMLQGKF